MRNLRALAIAAALLATMSHVMSAAGEGQRAGVYDFGYRVSGDFRAKPIQVFDNGTDKTYFQFRAGQPIPVVMAGEGQQILYPRAEGPYYVVDGVARDYTLAMGMSQARATHASVIAGVVKPAELAEPDRNAPASIDPQTRRASYAQPGPEARGDWTQNTFAQPLRGDVLQFQVESVREATVAFEVGKVEIGVAQTKALSRLAAAAGKGTRIEIIATDDDSLLDQLAERRGEAIRSVLVNAGVPAQSIRVTRARELGTVKVVNKRRTVDTLIKWYPSAPMVAAQPGGSAQYSPETVRLLASRGLITSARAAELLAGTAAEKGRAAAPRELAEFDLRRTDGTISAAVKRWGKANGYEVVWDTSVEAPITGDAKVAASDFKGALAKVTDGLQKAGYPIKVRLYADNVARFYTPD